MRIFVKAKTGAKTESVLSVDGVNFSVSVKEVPEKGKANKAIERLVAKYFKVSTQRVRVVSGTTATKKIIEII